MLAQERCRARALGTIFLLDRRGAETHRRRTRHATRPGNVSGNVADLVSANDVYRDRVVQAMR